MWLGLLITAALAESPLQVQVVPEPTRVRPDPVPSAPRARVPVGRGVRIQIDGEADAAWALVPAGPALVATRSGGVPPEGQMKVVAESGRVILWVPRTPGSQVLTLDPAGTQEGWWRVQLAEGVTAWWCTMEAVPLLAPWPTPPRAAPCTEAAVEAAVGAGWEIVLPAPALTNEALLGWVVDGPAEADGTWAPGGHSTGWPQHGRGLALPAPPIRLSSPPQLEAGSLAARWTGTPVLGTWTWRQVLGGRVLAQGEVRMEAQATTAWSASLVDAPGSTVVLTSGGDAWPRASASLRLGVAAGDAWVITPVATDRIELAVTAPVALTDTVTLRSQDGRFLASARIDVPAGASRVILSGTWGETTMEVRLTTLHPDPMRLVTR